MQKWQQLGISTYAEKRETMEWYKRHESNTGLLLWALVKYKFTVWLINATIFQWEASTPESCAISEDNDSL